MKIITGIVAAFLLSGCGQSDWKRTDNVDIINETKSPDGKNIATVFDCEGGGAAGYTYHNVNLRRATEELNQREFLLGKRLWHSYKDITVRWVDSAHLEVSYKWQGNKPDHKKRNGERVAEMNGIKIRYVLIPPVLK